MSFSKARIQRFNEQGSEAPPPGAYDPKFDNKVKGLVIEKSERFQDSKSVSSSGADCNVSVSSKGAGNGSTVTFKTPRLPRKRVVAKPSIMSSPKLKSKPIIGSKDTQAKYDSMSELADLKVECSNKDKTIAEHEKLIDELTDSRRRLEKRLEELIDERTTTADRHERDMEALAQLQREVLSSRDDKSRAELELLRAQLVEATENRECEIRLLRETVGELQSRIVELSARNASLEEKLSKRRAEDRILESLKDLKIDAEDERYRLQQEEVRRLEEDRATEVELLKSEVIQLGTANDEGNAIRRELEAKLEKRLALVLALQADLSSLEWELDEHKAETEKLVVDYERRIGDLEAEREDERRLLAADNERRTADLAVEYERRIVRLEDDLHGESEARLELEKRAKELSDTNDFLTEELKDVQNLYKDVKQRLLDAEDESNVWKVREEEASRNHAEEIAALERVHSAERARLQRLTEDARREYLEELEKMSAAVDREIVEVKETSSKNIKEIKERTDKRVENAEAVTRETLAACRAECEEKVKRVIAESDGKVNAMVEEIRSTVEEEMRLTAERYMACVKRTEAERAALDEKLAQRDREVNELSSALEELKTSVDTQESFNQSLQAELDRAEAELADKKEELRTLKDHIRSEAGEMVARRRRFEVVMAENQASVAALSRRLMQSDSEVERLQHELESGEACIYEYRNLLNAMRTSSKLVHEQMQALIDQLDAKKELVDQLEAGSVSEFNSIKTVFDAKIDSLKQVAAKEVARLQEECSKRTGLNEELRHQLDEMAGRLSEARDMLLKLEERSDTQVIEISRLQLDKCKIEKQLKCRNGELEDCKIQLEERAIECENVIDRTNHLIVELTEKVKVLESDRDYYKEFCLNADIILKEERVAFEEERGKWRQVEIGLKNKIERERAQRENAETGLKKLTESYDRLKVEYQEISDKYSQVLGHHNHKQKIKHISQLKDEILRLKQELEGKHSLVTQQQKTIETLKSDEKRSFAKGKENLQTTKVTHSTPVSSPHKPLTPLKDRND